jgi:hypothetical protein
MVEIEDLVKIKISKLCWQSSTHQRLVWSNRRHEGRFQWLGLGQRVERAAAHLAIALLPL